MTDIAKRLREIAAVIQDPFPRDRPFVSAFEVMQKLEAIAAELESQPAGDQAMPVFAEWESLGLGHWGQKWHREHEIEDGPLVRQRDALAAIAAARQERVPEGWKLVSRRVTQSMVLAGAGTPGMKKIDGWALLTQSRFGLKAPDPDCGVSWYDSPLAQAWAAMYDACQDPNTPVAFGPTEEVKYVPPPALDWSDDPPEQDAC